MKYCRTEGRAAKTVTKYGEIFRRVTDLSAELRRTSILGMDLKFVDEYRHRRVAAGRAPKTVYNESMILRQLVNFALSRGMISSDPLKGLRLKEPPPAPQPCWTADEVARILTASPEPQRAAFTLLAETGMRVGKLKWLAWEDVDRERNVLHVRPKPGWRPKTGDRRAIPMSPAVRALLDTLPRRGRWVLTAPPSERPPEG